MPITAALMLSAGAALAEAPPPSTKSGADKGNDHKETARKPFPIPTDSKPGQLTDTALLDRIHAINEDEISLGQMAEKRAQNKKIKDYGRMMAKDYQAADKEVASTAKKLNYVLTPPVLTDAEKDQQRDDAATKDKLASLTGADFDRELISAIQRGHEHAISLITEAQSRAEHKETKALLDKLLPRLQDHLKKANELMEKTPKPAAS